MTFNLFAFCESDGSRVVKRVPISADVQSALDQMFAAQEAEFFSEITEEVEFDGAWKPDPNELLVAALPPNAQPVTAVTTQGVLSIPELDTAGFDGEGIRALFGISTRSGNPRILIQSFSARQILSRRFSLFLDGNSFRKMSTPAFSIDGKLVGVIEQNKLKFKSFHTIRTIFDLVDLYKEATDMEIGAFSAHANIEVSNLETLKHAADQTVRKLVHAISKSGVLDDYAPADIASKATAVGITVTVNNGKIVLPLERAELKKLLRFLDDGLYEAALTGERYMTNSKKRLGS